MPGWQLIIERIRFAGSSVADQPLCLTSGLDVAAACLTHGHLVAAAVLKDGYLAAPVRLIG